MPNKLTKKVGPLPLWAWGAAGVLLVVMVIYFRRNQADDGGVMLEDGQIAGDLPGGETMTYVSGGGGPTGGGVTTDPGDFRDPIYEPPVVDPSSFYPPFGSYYPPPEMYETPIQPYLTETPAPPPPAPVQTKTAPAKQTSFMWGGKQWKKKDYAAFKKWLKERGADYAYWAKTHPKAAKDVFGKMT